MRWRRQPDAGPAPRVGLIARADDRGLGHMTWEFARALNPEKVLVVTLGAASTFPNRLERYPGALVAPWDVTSGAFTNAGRFQAPEDVRAWLSGLDVVYSAETFYDWRIVEWAREAGVATVLHVMPELLPLELPARPDFIWAPTTWRTDLLPEDTLVVPVPVAMDRAPAAIDSLEAGPLRVLHVAGRRAAADRNGTLTLLQALRLTTEQMIVTITTQDERLPASATARGVTLRTVLGAAAPEEYWRLYEGQDLLAMPRRYGGLCLPAQEAAAAGLGLVMTDTSPNHDYPAELVDGWQKGTIETPAGHVPMFEANARKLAGKLDELARDRRALAQLRSFGQVWAERHSWDVFAPIYRELLARAALAAR